MITKRFIKQERYPRFYASMRVCRAKKVLCVGVQLRDSGRQSLLESVGQTA